MTTLVTGTPGSGKTTLVQYAARAGDKRFFDADKIKGLCEWRESETGKVLGLVADYKETGKDEWYQKYGWYWRTDVLKQFLSDNPDSIICGSSENVVAVYGLFDRLFIIKKTKEELFHNLASPDRDNPFGKTEKQRANFMNWQEYLIKEAEGYPLTLVKGNNISEVYNQIAAKDNDE